ncbi:MAG: hypothetical protein KatS3mg027_0341 [Bacteroidia bacterium]|nr:MAG: hypothetical protein KatS3mg027_0341 [Bacteroidia bacterium]
MDELPGFNLFKKNKVPLHVAIIMDGNGRWAKKHGKDQHRRAQSGRRIRSVMPSKPAIECGVKYLTLYAFSTENWSRPKHEVDALMELIGIRH